MKEVLVVNLAYSMSDSKFDVQFSDGRKRSFDFLHCSTIKAEQLIINHLLKEGWEFHSAAMAPYETLPTEANGSPLYVTFLRKHIYFVR